MSNIANEAGHTYYPKYLWDKDGNPVKDENGKHKIAYSFEEENEFLKTEEKSEEKSEEPIKKTKGSSNWK